MPRKSQAAYQKKRYHLDGPYRLKRIASSTKWNKEHTAQTNAVRRKRYANRTPAQIEERNKLVKKRRASGKWKR